MTEDESRQVARVLKDPATTGPLRTVMLGTAIRLLAACAGVGIDEARDRVVEAAMAEIRHR